MIWANQAGQFLDEAPSLDCVRLQTENSVTGLGEAIKLFISEINMGLDIILTKT